MTTERMQLDTATPAGPVTCLGQTFASDTARREHYSALLREKLKDPAFRAIEGFPHGADDDIIALSDPPYYTACPNPWLADFVAEWEAAKPATQRDAVYSREPFAADVSEGKNDPIYNAHSYHTKVPHKAIMRYILHYTQPGDIVFDGFCGTGMTGVAAQMCGNKAEVESLGYRVDKDGSISQEVFGTDGKKTWQPFSKLGARKAILNDLSPAATFIAYNYNTPVDVRIFERETKRLLVEVEAECGWMYETTHSDKRKAKINYTVWSDVNVCPNCISEFVLWDIALDKDGEVLDVFNCPKCNVALNKREVDYAWETSFDTAINQQVKQNKKEVVLISYSLGTKRYEKKPDSFDRMLLDSIKKQVIPYQYPAERLMEGQETRRNDPIGITHTHHFYTKRNLWILANIWKRATSIKDPVLSRLIMSFCTATQINLDKRYAWRANGKGGFIKGTMYIPSFSQENTVFQGVKSKYSRYTSSLTKRRSFARNDVLISLGSCQKIILPTESFDYLFLDPPFGANLNYSELSSLWEAWLRVRTDTGHEAIENRASGKTLNHYSELMFACFQEAFRLLKPGRWMTVEFSNTSSAVWNVIQTSLAAAGFVVANVSALDKKQGSFKAVTTSTAVKQDLVISAYKPTYDFETRFMQTATNVEGVWEFVRNHLTYVPIIKQNAEGLVAVAERDPRILYDQVIAYYIRKGYPVPIDSADFQRGLAQRFVERDGMFFLADQVTAYDRAVQQSGNIIQTSLFVSDESSAIQWLRQVLKRKPQTFADINPEFMQQLGGWSKNETQLDLRILLEQNFLSYTGDDAVPDQIHAYLSSNYPDLRNKADTDPALRAKAKDRWYVPDPNKAQDLEQVRERALLREYDGYVAQTGKLRVFRLEAIRAGFKRAYQQQHYKNIVAMAKRLPTAVIEEDEKLLMWVDNATMRIGE
jgi:DNA modification methylase